MTIAIAERGLRLRRAEPGDADFIVDLVKDDDVEPFLSARMPKDRASVLEDIERSTREPGEFGRFVIEVAEEREWRRAGMMGFSVGNQRSRIARLGNLAVHPDFRGRRLADDAARLLQRHLLFDLDFHRLELEIYGFNERAQRHAERAGFVREGVKRKAYWRHGEWVDGVLYGLVREDLDERLESEDGGKGAAMSELGPEREEAVPDTREATAAADAVEREQPAERMQEEQDPEQNEP